MADVQDNELHLTQQELNSTVWLKIVAHYERRLQKHRERNDGNLPPDLTANVRGRIAEIKELLAAGTSGTSASDSDQ